MSLATIASSLDLRPGTKQSVTSNLQTFPVQPERASRNCPIADSVIPSLPAGIGIWSIWSARASHIATFRCSNCVSLRLDYLGDVVANDDESRHLHVLLDSRHFPAGSEARLSSMILRKAA